MTSGDIGAKVAPRIDAAAIDSGRYALADLCRKFRVRRLDLFGSAATGSFDPARSDVDLLVEFEPMPASAYAAAYFGLREELEILFERSVDLVTEAALENPYFRRRLDEEKRTLFPRS